MDVELLPILMVVSGTVLLYGAVKNKNPLGVIKAALTGGKLDDVPGLTSGGGPQKALPGGTLAKDLPNLTQPDGSNPLDDNPIDPGGSVFGGVPGTGSGAQNAPVSYVQPFGKWV